MSVNLTGAAYGGNLAMSKAGLAAGTTVTYTTGAALAYTQKGEYKTAFAAQTNQPLPATDAATGKAFVPLNPNESCVLLFAVNKSGAIACAQGPKVSTQDFQGGLAALQCPQLSDDFTPFGYMTLVATVALVGTWTIGVNNWAGVTGLTATAHDVMDYPAQPLITA